LRLTTKILVAGAIVALLAAYAPAQTTTPKKKSTSSTAHHRRHSKPRKGAWKKHGQQGIQPERARAIQEALIRENYLTGEPSGVWDTRTQDAMSRFQAANGWQNKVTPDSRALIKLGLGPNYSEKEMLRLDPKPADAVATNGNSTPSKQR
jgi:peptidoglycan hydrolase-like protein with peptidoglycan-binding domain